MGIKTVFVVDDSRVAQVILGRLLTAQGLDVTEMESGEKALSLLEQGQYPDLIFMDMMMPGLSGIETTAKIKEDTKTQHIPVVMCTGNDTALERESAMASGVNYFVAKPPVEGELEKVLAECALVHDVEASSSESATPTEIPVEASIGETIVDEVAPPVMVAATESPASMVIDESAIRESLKREFEEQIATAAESWMPMVMTQVKELMEQEKTALDQQIEEKAATWMPTVVSNVKSLIAQEESEAADVDEAAIAESTKQLGKEAAENAVADIVGVRVEEAVAEINLSAKIDELIETQTVGWLAIQQAKLEQDLLPIMQEKIADEVKLQVKAGLTEEAMLEIKSNVQDDVYATIEHLTENVINPLKYKIRLLTIALVALAAGVIIF